MKCPGCGAGVTQAMLEAGECEYCHTALERPKQKVAPAPVPVVHVTRIELGPRIEANEIGEVAGGVFDSVTTRLVGCVTGCLSSAISLLFTVAVMAAVAGYVGWTLYVSAQLEKGVEDHDHGGDGKGEKGEKADKDGKGKHR